MNDKKNPYSFNSEDRSTEEKTPQFPPKNRKEDPAQVTNQQKCTQTPKESLHNRLIPKYIGKYKLIRILGAGSMGKVFLGINPNTDSPIAIKTLKADLSFNEKVVERFKLEAKITAKLAHPNLVRALDAGYDEKTNFHYIICEFIDGQNLSEYLSAQGGTLSWQEASRIITCIAKVLAEAEECSIVHRDIKPGNIMISKEGEVKLTDLGVAKQLTNDSQLTLTEHILGTPAFISPEQIESSKDVDIRSDIYSLGVTFYHLLAGRFPFCGKSHYETLKMIEGDPTPYLCDTVPNIPKKVGDLVYKMMQKSPDNRHENCASLLRDLSRLSALDPRISSKQSQMEEALGESINLADTVETKGNTQATKIRDPTYIWNDGDKKNISDKEGPLPYREKVKPSPAELNFAQEESSTPTALDSEIEGYGGGKKNSFARRFFPRILASLKDSSYNQKVLFICIYSIIVIASLIWVFRDPPKNPMENLTEGMKISLKELKKKRDRFGAVIVKDTLHQQAVEAVKKAQEFEHKQRYELALQNYTQAKTYFESCIKKFEAMEVQGQAKKKKIEADLMESRSYSRERYDQGLEKLEDGKRAMARTNYNRAYQHFKDAKDLLSSAIKKNKIKFDHDEAVNRQELADKENALVWAKNIYVEAQEALKRGEEAFSQEKFEEATENFSVANQYFHRAIKDTQAEKIRKRKAIEQKNEVEKALKLAESSQVAKWVPKLFARGKNAMNQGNNAFQKGQYQQVLDHFSEAIESFYYAIQEANRKIDEVEEASRKQEVVVSNLKIQAYDFGAPSFAKDLYQKGVQGFSNGQTFIQEKEYLTASDHFLQAQEDFQNSIKQTQARIYQNEVLDLFRLSEEIQTALLVPDKFHKADQFLKKGEEAFQKGKFEEASKYFLTSKKFFHDANQNASIQLREQEKIAKQLQEVVVQLLQTVELQNAKKWATENYAKSETAILSGKNALDKRNYADAYSYFSQAEALLQQVSKEINIRKLREKVLSNREKADLANASTIAKINYPMGTNALVKGESAFAEARYRDAYKHYSRANDSYKNSLRELEIRIQEQAVTRLEVDANEIEASKWAGETYSIAVKTLAMGRASIRENKLNAAQDHFLEAQEHFELALGEARARIQKHEAAESRSRAEKMGIPQKFEGHYKRVLQDLKAGDEALSDENYERAIHLFAQSNKKFLKVLEEAGDFLDQQRDSILQLQKSVIELRKNVNQDTILNSTFRYHPQAEEAFQIAKKAFIDKNLRLANEQYLLAKEYFEKAILEENANTQLLSMEIVKSKALGVNPEHWAPNGYSGALKAAEIGKKSFSEGNYEIAIEEFSNAERLWETTFWEARVEKKKQQVIDLSSLAVEKNAATWAEDLFGEAEDILLKANNALKSKDYQDGLSSLMRAEEKFSLAIKKATKRIQQKIEEIEEARIAVKRIQNEASAVKVKKWAEEIHKIAEENLNKANVAFEKGAFEESLNFILQAKQAFDQAINETESKIREKKTSVIDRREDLLLLMDQIKNLELSLLPKNDFVRGEEAFLNAEVAFKEENFDLADEQFSKAQEFFNQTLRFAQEKSYAINERVRAVAAQEEAMQHGGIQLASELYKEGTQALRRGIAGLESENYQLASDQFSQSEHFFREAIKKITTRFDQQIIEAEDVAFSRNKFLEMKKRVQKAGANDLEPFLYALVLEKEQEADSLYESENYHLANEGYFQAKQFCKVALENIENKLEESKNLAMNSKLKIPEKMYSKHSILNAFRLEREALGFIESGEQKKAIEKYKEASHLYLQALEKE